jgi:hypothetical protein
MKPFSLPSPSLRFSAMTRDQFQLGAVVKATGLDLKERSYLVLGPLQEQDEFTQIATQEHAEGPLWTAQMYVTQMVPVQSVRDAQKRLQESTLPEGDETYVTILNGQDITYTLVAQLNVDRPSSSRGFFPKWLSFLRWNPKTEQ